MAEMKIGESVQGPVQGQLHSGGAHNELDRVAGELDKKTPTIVTAQASASASEVTSTKIEQPKEEKSSQAPQESAPAVATLTPLPMGMSSGGFDFEEWRRLEQKEWGRSGLGSEPETKIEKFLANPSSQTLKEALKEVYDPNGDGKISLQEAKDFNAKIKTIDPSLLSSSLNKLPEAELREMIKKEGSDGKEISSAMVRGLGLEISPEAAIELQKGLAGAAKEALATRKGIISASKLDLDGNKEVDKAEAEKSAESLKVAVSQFPLQAKQAILKNDEILRKEDPTGQKEADEYTKNTGIKMTAEAALAIREAKKAGAESPNPDPDKAKEEEKEKEKQAKGGKGFGGGILEMIIGFIMAIFGIKQEDDKKETEVAAKQNTPAAEKKEDHGKAGQGVLLEQPKTAITELNDNIQQKIDVLAGKLRESGVLASGVEAAPQAPAMSVGKKPDGLNGSVIT